MQAEKSPRPLELVVRAGSGQEERQLVGCWSTMSSTLASRCLSWFGCGWLEHTVEVLGGGRRRRDVRLPGV